MSEASARQQVFSGTRAPVQAIDLGRLDAYFRSHLASYRGPLHAEQFRGGQSNPTYKLIAPSGPYVLRRKPPGPLLPSAHAIDREYRVISALHAAHFPVPRPLVYCADESIIGSEFYVMDFVAGRIFWEPYAPGLDGPSRAALFANLNGTMARLHTLDLARLGLADFGRPEGYVARQIKRWTAQYRASETEPIDAMDRLIAFLPDAVPPDSGRALVHGDFRLDNCIVASGEPRILAVLDWELSTLGDPLADFTYHLMQWFMPVSEAGIGSLKGHESDPGVPAFEDYVSQYCEAIGRSEIPALDVYLAFNFFRLAAILQGIAGRVRDGTAANDHAVRMVAQIRPLAGTAWAFAQKAGA